MWYEEENRYSGVCIYAHQTHSPSSRRKAEHVISYSLLSVVGKSVQSVKRVKSLFFSGFRLLLSDTPLDIVALPLDCIIL